MSYRKVEAITRAIVLLAVFALAAPAFALLCAADDVPAATLLFPFVTGRYSPSSTAQNPVADRTSPHTIFSITNVSSTPRIVHLTLHNDFGFPLLGWDMLFNGYQTIEVDFADVMEGRLPATGGENPPLYPGSIEHGGGAVGWSYPTPSMPTGQSAGARPATTDSLYGLCTNPDVTPQGPLALARLGEPLPEYLRVQLYQGLRKSRVMSDMGWWLPFPPFFMIPNWIWNLDIAGPVAGYITADAVAACGGGGPADGMDYFSKFAIPATISNYAGNASIPLRVAMGNSLLGSWMSISDGGGSLELGKAVAIEADNQDVPNDDRHPAAIDIRASFYRAGGPGCAPGELDYEPAFCEDYFTGTGGGQDFVRASPIWYGDLNGDRPSRDFRESLPSAFAYRWVEGGGMETSLRVWKDSADVQIYYGFTLTGSYLAYSTYAFDYDGRAWIYSNDCPATCPMPPHGEVNQFPLAVQEISTKRLELPRTELDRGWAIIAFAGSNGVSFPIPGGYSDPVFASSNMQAWVEVVYETESGARAVVPATPLGNDLCDRHAVAAEPRNGRDRTDLGNVFY